MTAWEKVEIARNPKRKTSLDYIDEILMNLWNYMEIEISKMIKQLFVD